MIKIEGEQIAIKKSRAALREGISGTPRGAIRLKALVVPKIRMS
jgi:hypothetical protein